MEANRTPSQFEQTDALWEPVAATVNRCTNQTFTVASLSKLTEDTAKAFKMNLFESGSIIL